MRKLRPQALVIAALFMGAAVGQTVASAGTFPGANGKIAFATGHIEVIDPDGSGRVSLAVAPPASSVSEPAWNATGTKLVFREGNGVFRTMNADGSNVKLLFDTKTFAGNPTWSADGNVVAFEQSIDLQGSRRIYVVPAAGGSATELVALRAKDPTYSPDGAKIAFENHADSNPDIGVMNADGSNAVSITSGAFGNDGDFDPSWSPDGKKIAFKRAKQIWTMAADGSELTQLTSGTDASYPTWSPDGTKIAFERDDDIWVMDADGSDAVNITNTTDVDERDPDWGAGTPPPPPAEGIQFSADAYEVTEGGGNSPSARTVRGAVITVVRTGSTTGTATMRFTTSDGTAKSSSIRKCKSCKIPPPDYLKTSGTLVFGDGETTRTFTVPIIDDGLIEDDETVNLTLKRVEGRRIDGPPPGERSTAVLTIRDDDPNVSFERAASSGPESVGVARLKVLLSAPVSRVTVGYSVTGGTATAGQDYTLAAGTLSFGGRSPKSATIPLTIVDDDLKEQDETVRVELSSPANAELGRNTTHTFTIKDDDPQGDVAGDTPASALAVDLVTQPRQVIRESLSPANDVDVYRVHLEAGDDLAIDVDPGGKLGARLESSTLTILGPDATTELAVVGASEEPDGSGLTEHPAHLFTAATEGDHYLGLSTDDRPGLYRIELHRLALAEGSQDPAVLDVEGPMFAWLRGDTLGITGPTGYGFALQGPWTHSTTFVRRFNTTSSVYTLAAGSEVDIRTAFGDLRMETLADIVVETGPSLWGETFGELGPDPIPLRLGIPLDALIGDLRDRYGLDMTVSALESWTIMSGTQIMEGGGGLPKGSGLPKGIHQVMPGIPYLLFNDKPTIAASFGLVRIEQEALDQKLLVILDPTDPFLYIQGEDIGEVKKPTIAFSRRGYIPFRPDLQPTLPGTAGLTDFSSHVFASGGMPAPHPLVAKYITTFADGSIDLDANDDATWLAGEGNAHQLVRGDLSAIGEVLRDINLGANGRVIFHYDSKKFDFETALGRATAVYNGPEEALWFRAKQGPESSPLDGTPFSFLTMTQQNFFEGTIRSDGTFSVTGGTAYVSDAGTFEIELSLDNDGIAADVRGQVKLKGEWEGSGCTATAGARGLLEFSYSNGLHVSGSLGLDGKIVCKLAGEEVASAKVDVSGAFEDGKIKFKLPYIGTKSIRLF